jgi:predicted enzyme related to lactoylglutathione lyase
VAWAHLAPRAICFYLEMFQWNLPDHFDILIR